MFQQSASVRSEVLLSGGRCYSTIPNFCAFTSGLYERCFSAIPNFLFFHIVFNFSISIYQLLQLQLEFSTSEVCEWVTPPPGEPEGANDHSAATPFSEILSSSDTHPLYDALPW